MIRVCFNYIIIEAKGNNGNFLLTQVIQLAKTHLLATYHTVMSKCYNINWKDVQRKNVVNNVDMSSLRTPWQNDTYKNKPTENHKNTQKTKTQQTFRLYQTIFVMLFFYFYFYLHVWYLKWLLRKGWVAALVRSMTFIRLLNQF